ncbi:MAG: DUF2934 domain-containing protein [Xanthobacteraceae bacterium]|jgi:Protein of unknown function (DUF2934)
MEDFDERVKQRAYRLWVEEGCPEGRSDVHWDKARELVAIEENQKLATKPVPRGERARGEPVEPIEAVRNAGEFPTLTDQGEQPAPRRPSAAAARAPAKRKAAEPKSPKNGGTKRR